MRYFQSNKNFNQYKPQESFWQRWKKRRQKKQIKIEGPLTPLKNPYKKEPDAGGGGVSVVFVLFIILIIAWTALMLTLPYFKIKNITINGNAITSAQDVENFTRQSIYFKNGLISKNNYFLFSQDKLSLDIKNQFLYDDVQIKKIFPDTIKIDITEKKAQVIYDDGKDYNLLDADGRIVKTISIPPQTIADAQDYFITTSTTGTIENKHLTDYQNLQSKYGQMPIILNTKTIQPKKSEFLISAKIIKSVLDWTKQIKGQGIGEVSFFSLGDNDTNLKISLNQPWYLLINTELDYQTQIKNLKIILANNQPNEYIDLRFGERVYWK